jgi:hypothetical protein
MSRLGLNFVCLQFGSVILFLPRLSEYLGHVRGVEFSKG